MSNKIFRYAAALTPLIGWLIALLMFAKTFVGKYGQFQLECKSLVCRWISVDTEGNPTEYDPEMSGSLMIIIAGLLMLILNVATYVQIRVIRLRLIHEIQPYI